MNFPEAMLTHIGFYVRDIEVMRDFYRRVMGLVVTDEGDAAERSWVFMSRDPEEHHQLVLATGRPADGFQQINQISFRVGSLNDLRAYFQMLQAECVPGLEAVSHGNSWSVYFLDPEGNRIEIYAKSRWYVSQPFRKPVDLADSVERLEADLDALTQTDPSRVPIHEWQQTMKQRMGRS